MTVTETQQDVTQFVERFESLKAEIGKFIVGQSDVVENVLIAVLCQGHVLLEGVPGLGKTALVNTLAKVLDLQFRRVQFTPDLLPSDIVGTNILIERHGDKVFEFQPGPVFCNILLADEINRATPKTQSALLETMAERSVTVAGNTHPLPSPFFVLATQNPIESDGTYPLPEAQLDRFFFKLKVNLPSHDEYSEILNRTGGLALPQVDVVATGHDVLHMGRTLKQVPIEKQVQDQLVQIVRATHPEDAEASADVKQYVRHGASPRAAQAMLAGARVRALLDGRFHVANEDIHAVALPAMRHRLILSFEAEAQGMTTDDVIEKILKQHA